MSPSDNQKRIASAIALAVAIATPAEGLRRWAYDDTGGVLTVCEGHTGKDVIRGKEYSLAQCDALMEQDMKEAVLTVERCVPGLPANVLGAFADIVYNEGDTPICDTKHSKLARYLKAGMIKEACSELPKWDKTKVGGALIPLPGLTKRRNAEMIICLEG